MSTNAPNAEDLGIPEPAFFTELRTVYSRGQAHAFCLHFNVSDYVAGNLDLRTYLAAALANREVVCFYNRASGIEFPPGELGQQMRDKFLAAVGLNTPQAQAFAQMAGANGGLPRDPAAALPLLEKLLRQSDVKSAVLLDFAHTLCPDGNVGGMSPDDRANLIHVQRWARDQFIAAANNPLILIAPTLGSIHQDLRAASSRIRAIEIPMPDEASRLEFINDLCATEALNLGIPAEEFARVTAGLCRIHLEDITLAARADGRAVDLQLIRDQKQHIIRQEYDENIEILDPEEGFEAIFGLDYIKEFFRRNIIRPLLDGNTERCPMGVLLMGPAGTGKTRMARAVAKEAGVNFVVLNLARILGGVVGSSERNLERALKCIRAMAPTIVFVDEVDQSVTRSSGQLDSGVTARLFKRLLEEMAAPENRGRVVWLGATNRPDMIDAALKREGRLGDRKILFLPPDPAGREACLLGFSRRYMGAAELPAGNLQTIVDRTHGWTGAELETMITIAAEIHHDEGLEPDLAILAALDCFRPTTAAIEEMTQAALAEVNDLRLLPPVYREAWERSRREKEEAQASADGLKDLGPVIPAGRAPGRVL